MVHLRKNKKKITSKSKDKRNNRTTSRLRCSKTLIPLHRFRNTRRVAVANHLHRPNYAKRPMCTESISTHNFTFPFGEITSQIHKLWCKSESPCSTTICSRHPPNCVIRAMKRSYSTEQCANVFYVARFARNIPQRSLWLIYAIALGYLCFKSCLRVFFCLQSFHIHKLCLFCS